MMNRLYMKDLERIVMKYEEYRQALQREMERRQQQQQQHNLLSAQVWLEKPTFYASLPMKNLEWNLLKWRQVYP